MKKDILMRTGFVLLFLAVLLFLFLASPSDAVHSFNQQNLVRVSEVMK